MRPAPTARARSASVQQLVGQHELNAEGARCVATAGGAHTQRQRRMRAAGAPLAPA